MRNGKPQGGTELREHQRRRWDAMLAEVMGSNAFYREKLSNAGNSVGRPPRIDDLASLPFTSKAELAADQTVHGPFGTNLTYPLSAYTRVHQTSGTTGRPIRWLDTPESWRWWLDCWTKAYEAAGVTESDRIFIAFSFGPFIGLWTAFEAGQRLKAMVISGGGLTTGQRLDLLLDHETTVLVCTPTYALRMAEVARTHGFDLAAGPVEKTINAGEPGAGIANVKARIEREWGAQCFDHAGATELGAWGFGCGHGLRMHVNEEEFVAEVVDPETGAPVEAATDGYERGEMVLTNLGRVGSPLIRYRTGDLVAMGREPCACGRTTVHLEGGILGRVDGMIVVRGVPVFPSAIEDIVRSFPEVEEFEVEVATEREMHELIIQIEVPPDLGDTLARDLAGKVRQAMSLRARVTTVRPGTLPRYDIKSARFKSAPTPCPNRHAAKS